MAIAVLVVIGDANDEGRRPAGQYPIGDQGGGRCTSIPGDGAACEPVPAGQWHKTWRAIASSSGDDCLGTGLSQSKISRHGHIVITSVKVTRLAVLGSIIRVA